MTEDAKTVLMQLMCGVFIKLDSIHQIAAKHGHAAHMAGNTQAQDMLERVAHALIQAQSRLTEAMLAMEDSK